MTRFALLALPLLVAACGGSTLRPPFFKAVNGSGTFSNRG